MHQPLFCLHYVVVEFEPAVTDTCIPLLHDSGFTSFHLAVDGKTFAIIREHFFDSIYQRV